MDVELVKAELEIIFLCFGAFAYLIGLVMGNIIAHLDKEQ